MKRILVPIDFSDVTERVMRTVLSFTDIRDADVMLLHVVQPEPEFVGYDPGPDVVRTAVARDVEIDKRQLIAFQQRLEKNDVNVTVLSVQGPAIEIILAECKKLDADLIVMGSHGHGSIYNLLVGSVTEGVLHQSEVPVMVVPAVKD